MIGLSLSHDQPVEEMPKIAEKLYCKDGGHNKFLESIVVWLDIHAPRYWWQQFDTYRVGMTKQSSSTVHTLLQDVLTQYDFVEPIPQDFLWQLNNYIERDQLLTVKAMLPEGFLQRRICCTNYQTLRRIIKQRQNHKLPEWQRFSTAILLQIDHKEFFDDLRR